MSTPTVHAIARHRQGAEPVRLALLGTGTVGSAVLERLQHLGTLANGAAIRLVHVANSRAAHSAPEGIAANDAEQLLASACAGKTLPTTVDDVLTTPRTGIVIDATACADVAARHAHWLSAGIHVATANKLAQGGRLAEWTTLRHAQLGGGTHYGDSATVGAGLPLLRTIRALREGGDRIHALAGCLSGSLAWLFDRFDGTQPFSHCIRAAQASGLTEPDPREDLSGADVQRKLLILARAAGLPLEPDDVDVEPLSSAALADCPRQDIDERLVDLDRAMHGRLADAQRQGKVLRHVARLSGDGRASIGLEALAGDNPLALGRGTDNRVAIWSDRYRDRPLVIQGPGAGAQVTAAALLDDVLAIARVVTAAG